MSLHLECVTLDAHDPDRLARFWAETLDYQIEYDSKNDAGNDAPEREIVLGPKTGSTTKLLIVEVHDEKKAKNRLHFDLRPENQAAEVARVEALGHAVSTSVRASRRGWYWRTPRATSSASCAPTPAKRSN